MDLISLIGANLGLALIFAAAFLVALTVVVFVHEFGHFQVARWCGVSVKAFSIGFGPELLGWHDRQGTRWRIAAVPLGGYVQFIDDANPASAGAAAKSNEPVAQRPTSEATQRPPEDELTDEQRAGAFHSKPIWKRAAVVAAGPIANFLLAIAIFAATFMISGYPIIDTTVAEVTPGSPAAAAGFEPGDTVKSINGQEIEGFSDLKKIVSTHVGQSLDFVVLRDGTKMTLTATPQLKELDDPIGGKVKQPVIGILVSGPPEVDDILPDSIADKAGFRPGDVIVSVNDAPVRFFLDVSRALQANGGKPIAFGVKRGDAELKLTATPPQISNDNVDKALIERPVFGILARNGRLVSVGPIEAVARGVQRTSDIITGTLSYLGDVFTGRQGAEQIGGIVRIADAAGKIATIDWRILISFIAFISVSIGLINLFPVPVLDGGHLVLFAIEAIRGRPVPEDVQEFSFRVGFAIILTLLIFTLWNDRLILARWFTWTS